MSTMHQILCCVSMQYTSCSWDTHQGPILCPLDSLSRKEYREGKLADPAEWAACSGELYTGEKGTLAFCSLRRTVPNLGHLPTLQRRFQMITQRIYSSGCTHPVTRWERPIPSILMTQPGNGNCQTKNGPVIKIQSNIWNSIQLGLLFVLILH